MLPMTAVVAAVSVFPFRSLASAGAGTEAEPSGMPGRQRCARSVMGYISLDKMMLPDTLPVRATLEEQAANTHTHTTKSLCISFLCFTSYINIQAIKNMY